VNKADADKARKRLLAKIKRELSKGGKPTDIAKRTGYTPARIYQIRSEMVEAGILDPLRASV
jgi:hypothetical protein